MNYYKVKEFSELMSVAIPTLHYYDEIGLLKPSHTGASGDQFYSDNEVLRLTQIMCLQFMGLPLEKIKFIVMNTTNIKSALKNQEKLMIEEAEKLTQLADLAGTLAKNLDNQKNSIVIKTKNKTGKELQKQEGPLPRTVS